MTIRVEEFVKLELEMIRKKKEKMKELKENAWKSDIDPEVYYSRDIEEIAKDRINYSRAMEIIEDLQTIYTGVSRELTIKNNQERINTLENQKRNSDLELQLELRKMLAEKL